MSLTEYILVCVFLLSEKPAEYGLYCRNGYALWEIKERFDSTNKTGKENFNILEG